MVACEARIGARHFANVMCAVSRDWGIGVKGSSASFSCWLSSTSSASLVHVRAISVRMACTLGLGARAAICRHSAARSRHSIGVIIMCPRSELDGGRATSTGHRARHSAREGGCHSVPLSAPALNRDVEDGGRPSANRLIVHIFGLCCSAATKMWPDARSCWNHAARNGRASAALTRGQSRAAMAAQPLGTLSIARH